MSEDAFVRGLLVDRAAAGFVASVADMVAANPHPHGMELRLTVTAADGRKLGEVPVDITNLWELGYLAARRAAAPAGRPSALHLVRGEA